jgi:hypothetical protein
MLEEAYFPESWLLIFDFLTVLLHLMWDLNPEQKCIPVPVPILLRQKVTVPATSVPQHCLEYNKGRKVQFLYKHFTSNIQIARKYHFKFMELYTEYRGHSAKTKNNIK